VLHKCDECASIPAQLHQMLEGSLNMANHPEENTALKLCQKTEEREKAAYNRLKTELG